METKKFKDWAIEYYKEFEGREPVDDECDTLRDKLAARIMLVLMINGWEDNKKKRYKNRYISFSRDDIKTNMYSKYDFQEICNLCECQ